MLHKMRNKISFIHPNHIDFLRAFLQLLIYENLFIEVMFSYFNKLLNCLWGILQQSQRFEFFYQAHTRIFHSSLKANK